MSLSRPSFFAHLPLGILTLLLGLCGLGILSLYSAADGHFYPWAFKQSLRLALGVALMIGIAWVDLRFWQSASYVFYLFSLLLLISVDAMGYIGMGARRWINLYVFNLQPSELMKLSLILALARWFSGVQFQGKKKVLRALGVPIVLTLLPVFFIARQPDLGTALTLLMIGGVLFLMSGAPWWFFAATFIGVGLSFPLFWSFLHEYQRKRILMLFNPESDPTQAGYHILQSKIALGSGGWFGKGFNQGTQSHLNFLPEKQTDFIFTLFCEEFGFVGGLCLLLLYVTLIAYSFHVAFQSRSYYGSLVALGMGSALFLYTFINIAMVSGLLPVVGIPLPFMSYGGTSLLTSFMGQGFIFSVLLYQKRRMGQCYTF